MLTETQNKYRRGLGKSVAHGQIQRYLKNQIPSLELEKSLGSRRGDAVWEERKIVFEIQLSPIALAEALSRNRDYALLGYQVVWILHEGVFNGRKVYSAEKTLRASHPTYYSNGAAIYDQIEVISGRRRIYRSEPLPIDITAPCLPFIKIPDRAWPLHFVGDIHTFCATQGAEEVQKILQKNRQGWLQFMGLRILEVVSTYPK